MAVKNAFNIWFDTFLEEKGLGYVCWDIESDNDGMTHYIDNEVVIEHIRITSPKEQNQIKNMLIKIDFANASVNEFLKYLAKAIVNGYRTTD